MLNTATVRLCESLTRFYLHSIQYNKQHCFIILNLSLMCDIFSFVIARLFLLLCRAAIKRVLKKDINFEGVPVHELHHLFDDGKLGMQAEVGNDDKLVQKWINEHESARDDFLHTSKKFTARKEFLANKFKSEKNF